MRRLLAHRDVRVYLAGQVFSLFGDSSLWLAMGIWVKTLTGSNAQAGLVFFFFTAPSLLAPASGLLPDANGALRTAQESLRLTGPLAGAGLFVAVGAHVVAVIDAASFAFPVLSLLVLRVREPAPRPAAGRWAAQLSAGARHIWRTVELRHVIAAGAVTTTVFGFGETISYAVAGNGLHRPAAFVGVLAGVQGAGAAAGGLSAAPLVRRLGEGRLIGIAILVAAAGAAMEIPPLLAPVLAGDIVFGAAIPWLVVGLISLAQRVTPPELQGRVYAATETLITTPQTISIALGAALITVAGHQTLLLAMAATIALAGCYLLTRPEQRQAARSSLRSPNPADGNGLDFSVPLNSHVFKLRGNVKAHGKTGESHGGCCRAGSVPGLRAAASASAGPGSYAPVLRRAMPGRGTSAAGAPRSSRIADCKEKFDSRRPSWIP